MLCLVAIKTKARNKNSTIIRKSMALFVKLLIFCPLFSVLITETLTKNPKYIKLIKPRNKW